MKASIPALAALVLALALPAPADAAQPPRVSGQSCATLAGTNAATSIWWAGFYGEREEFFGGRRSYRAVPCFKSEATCKAWLYWAQTDWPLMTNVQRCRRGLPS